VKQWSAADRLAVCGRRGGRERLGLLRERVAGIPPKRPPIVFLAEKGCCSGQTVRPCMC